MTSKRLDEVQETRNSPAANNTFLMLRLILPTISLFKLNYYLLFRIFTHWFESCLYGGLLHFLHPFQTLTHFTLDHFNHFTRANLEALFLFYIFKFDCGSFLLAVVVPPYWKCWHFCTAVILSRISDVTNRRALITSPLVSSPIFVLPLFAISPNWFYNLI